jgi:hypothetical protein
MEYFSCSLFGFRFVYLNTGGQGNVWMINRQCVSFLLKSRSNRSSRSQAVTFLVTSRLSTQALSLLG